MNEGYILFYDSGIGGLTTLKETINLLPNENYLYFADDKNCPYGNKEQEEISSLVYKNVKKLLNRYNIKMLVFACNTITTCCVEQFRTLYNLEIVGIEPAIMPAMSESEKKEVLCIATKATFKQNKYTKLIDKAEGKVYSIGFKNLAKDIESAFLNLGKINLNEYLFQINKIKNETQVDSLVLGCTHFSFLKEVFKEKTNLKVFDGNLGVAKRVKSLLEEKDNLKDKKEGSLKIILSSNDKNKRQRYMEIYGELLKKGR